MSTKPDHQDHPLESRFLLFGDEWATDEVDLATFRARWWPAHIEGLATEDSAAEHAQERKQWEQMDASP